MLFPLFKKIDVQKIDNDALKAYANWQRRKLAYSFIGLVVGVGICMATSLCTPTILPTVVICGFSTFLLSGIGVFSVIAPQDEAYKELKRRDIQFEEKTASSSLKFIPEFAHRLKSLFKHRTFLPTPQEIGIFEKQTALAAQKAAADFEAAVRASVIVQKPFAVAKPLVLSKEAI